MADASRTVSEKAVVIRLSSLGDVVLSTGPLAHWRERYSLDVTVLTRAAYAPLFEHHPAVIETVGLEESQLAGVPWLATVARLAWKYRGRTLIDLHGSLRTRALGLAWRGPVERYPKLTLSRKRFAQKRDPAMRERLLAANTPQRYAQALDALPPEPHLVRPLVALTDQERTHGAEMVAERGMPKTPGSFVAIHPYATHANKAWPADRWRRLTRLLDQAGYPWLVVGRSEQPVDLGSERRDLTNATNLRETCAVLSQAAVCVTGDSGPLHLARAVGTPVVGLFGPTTREWGFYPDPEEGMVLEREGEDCRPCSRHGGATCERERACLELITTEDVMAAVETYL